MSTDETTERVRAILARALKIDVKSIPHDASQTNLSEWDSVRHMNVVIGLENEFEIEFDDAELPGLTSVPLLVAAVQKHAAG
jgi:acyl carrier protein